MPPSPARPSVLRRLRWAVCLLAVSMPALADPWPGGPDTDPAARPAAPQMHPVALHGPSGVPASPPLMVAQAASTPMRGVHGSASPPELPSADPPAFLLLLSGLIVVLFISARRNRRED